MLLIAISHGYDGSDPFSCSTPDVSTEELDPKDANACRAFICKDKHLNPIEIDEVLVVYGNVQTSGPEVIHYHHEFDK